MEAQPFWSRLRVTVPLLSCVVLLVLAGWSVASGNGDVPDLSSPQFASRHIAAMRAALAAIHKGKVNATVLAEIAGAGADLVAIHRGRVDSATLEHIEAISPGTEIVPASYEDDDIGREIRRYISTPAPGTARLAAASVPDTQAPDTKAAPAGDAGDARTFVGQKVCESCHQQEAANWAHTIHAAVFTLNPRNAVEARGCEACHGPGSAHVANPSDLSTIISFSHKSLTPIPAQNAQCLSCHEGGPRIFWHGSIHEDNNLACSDCHNPMANFSAHGLTARASINETCFSCHKVQRAQFNMRSHMPLPEGKMSCTDCHSPHGSTTDPLLKANSVNEVCYSCHADKRGPFLFEHAPVRESCLNCHNPHGSNFESLLTAPRPMLCQQCHAQDGHPAQLLTRGNLAGGPMPDPRLISTSCQTCHVNVHGSNDPSGSRFER
jgi:DmsE family decaheme c-type cytochrome